MKYLVGLVCLCAVVSAIPWSNCGILLPPPEPCLGKLLDAPEPPPIAITGLLTSVIESLKANGITKIEQFEEQQKQFNHNLLIFFREAGPEAVNNTVKTQYLARQAGYFWQNLLDVASDILYGLNVKLNEAYVIIEREFRLVIDRTQVRAWLRELRDLGRVVKNQCIQAIEKRRVQWYDVVQQYIDKLGYLDVTLECVNPNLMQERYYRVMDLGFAELTGVVNQLKADTIEISLKIIHRVFELANNIYDVEVMALKNLLT